MTFTTGEHDGWAYYNLRNAMANVNGIMIGNPLETHWVAIHAVSGSRNWGRGRCEMDGNRQLIFSFEEKEAAKSGLKTL